MLSIFPKIKNKKCIVNIYGHFKVSVKFHLRQTPDIVSSFHPIAIGHASGLLFTWKAVKLL